MENLPSDENVENSVIDASANASDTTSAQIETPNFWESLMNGSNAGESTTVQDTTDELEETLEETADDQIPAEENDEDAKEPAEEKKPRSKNFKELQEAKAALETQLAERDEEAKTVKAKLTTLDEALESYGGVEQVGSLIENQNKFIDPARYREAVDYILTLPQAPAVQAEILNRSFALGDVKLDAAAEAKAIANRVSVVNSALAKDFGLSANLSDAEMQTAFQWLATRANKDKSELLTDLQDELDLLAPDEVAAADRKTQERIAALEKQIEEQQNSKDGENPPAQTDEPLDQENIIKILNDYESDVIAKTSADVLKDYNTTLEQLSPLKAEAIKALVRQKLGSGDIFVKLADYLITDPNHDNGKFLGTQYKNAVKTLIRSVAVEFLGKPPAAPKQKPSQPGITGDGKSSIKTHSKKKEENPWSPYVR